MPRETMILVAALSLAGCATEPLAKPAVEVRYQTVNVPVATPCVTKDQIPAEPEKVGDKIVGDPRRDLDTISASALRLRAWGKTLAAILIGCTAP